MRNNVVAHMQQLQTLVDSNGDCGEMAACLEATWDQIGVAIRSLGTRADQAEMVQNLTQQKDLIETMQGQVEAFLVRPKPDAKPAFLQNLQQGLQKMQQLLAAQGAMLGVTADKEEASSAATSRRHR